MFTQTILKIISVITESVFRTEEHFMQNATRIYLYIFSVEDRPESRISPRSIEDDISSDSIEDVQQDDNIFNSMLDISSEDSQDNPQTSIQEYTINLNIIHYSLNSCLAKEY